MQRTATDPNHFAQDLFAPLPRRYDLLEHLLSLGQNERWRREMISHVGRRDPQTVLDVATGTAGVALGAHPHDECPDHRDRHHRADAAGRS